MLPPVLSKLTHSITNVNSLSAETDKGMCCTLSCQSERESISMPCTYKKNEEL